MCKGFTLADNYNFGEIYTKFSIPGAKQKKA